MTKATEIRVPHLCQRRSSLRGLAVRICMGMETFSSMGESLMGMRCLVYPGVEDFLSPDPEIRSKEASELTS